MLAAGFPQSESRKRDLMSLFGEVGIEKDGKVIVEREVLEEFASYCAWLERNVQLEQRNVALERSRLQRCVQELERSIDHIDHLEYYITGGGDVKGWGGEGDEPLRDDSLLGFRSPVLKDEDGKGRKSRQKKSGRSTTAKRKRTQSRRIPKDDDDDVDDDNDDDEEEEPEDPPKSQFPRPVSAAKVDAVAGTKRSRDKATSAQPRRQVEGCLRLDQEQEFLAHMNPEIAANIRMQLHGHAQGPVIHSPTPSGYWTNLSLAERWSESTGEHDTKRRKRVQDWQAKRYTDGKKE